MALEKLRVVFDCNIFLQTLLNPKSVAAKCFELVRSREVILFVSKDTLDEVRDVVFRPNITSILPNLTTEQIEAFIDEVKSISVYLKTLPKAFDFKRDPKDEIIIDLAIFCESDFIVTRDNDLLDLMTGIDDDSKEFRQRFRSLKVVEPIEFLKIIENKDLPLEP